MNESEQYWDELEEAATKDISGNQESTQPTAPPRGELASVIGLSKRYRILCEIARGGMGVVLRVQDASFDRPLAIKVLRPGFSETAVYVRRFLDEARITGQLQHPGIPPAHEIGRLGDGRPFFTMKLIEGRTLADLLAERPTPQADMPRFLKIYEQIAQTIAYAHSQGVIHRDLKPLNIMVGAFGEVQVMDWGLAKRLVRASSTEDLTPSTSKALGPRCSSQDQTAEILQPETVTEETQVGQVLGTIAYMAPEQARGEVQALSERCDVFGLGALLCAILTGRPPYVGADSQDLWIQARDAKLGDAFQRLATSGADPDLVKLTTACLAADPADRPGNAGEVAERMATYLASVQDRLQQTRVAQAQAEVKASEEHKRRRLAVSLAVAVVVLVASTSAFGLWYVNDQARRQQEHTKRELETASRKEHVNREVLAALDESIRLRDGLHAQLRDPRSGARLLSDLTEWRSLLEAATAAWTRADVLASSDRELITPNLQARLTESAEQLRADERDRLLAFELDKIRLESSGLVEGQINLQHAGPRLAQSFHDAGYDIEQGSPAEVATYVRDSAIRIPLVAGLDFWALVTDDRNLQARLLETARIADPDPWRDRFRQVEVWQDRSKLDALAAEVDFTEQSPQLLTALAQRLRLTRGDAVGLLGRALVFHPRDFWMQFELGLASGNPAEQAGAFRAALAVRPDDAVTHYNLGVILYGERKLEQAAVCFQRATELDPTYAGAYNNLGLILDDQQKYDEAIDCYKKAIEFGENTAIHYINLGATLFAQNKLDEAIACFRQALAIAPEHDAAHNNLGAALRQQGKLDEAIGEFRKTIDINPNHGMAWCNLGHTLQQQGNCREALAALRRGHELGSQQKDWSYPSAEWVRDSERRAALDEKLPAILRGEVAAADAQENLTLAELSMIPRKFYAAAARFYADAFEADPGLADNISAGHRYNAACAAALANAGQGLDAAALSDDARTGLRQQAIDYLASELTAWTRLLDNRPDAASDVARNMQHWLSDSDLASLRDDAAITQLPPDEQTALRKIWSDVTLLHQRASAN